MKRNHFLSEKLPLLSMLLAFLWALFALTIPMAFFSSELVGNYVVSIMGVVLLIIQMWWFSPAYKGALRVEVPASEIWLLSIPFLVNCVLNYIFTVVDSGLYFAPTAVSLSMAVSAGFCEETFGRGVTVPIGMRYFKGKNKILKVTIITSLVFGAMHLMNIGAGASVTMGVIQTFATTGKGLFFAAIFLRTGSILIPMLMHSFFDWVCFVTDPTLQSGIMMSESVTVGLVLATAADIAIGIVGLYMIRPAMRERIEEVWNKKWSL